MQSTATVQSSTIAGLEARVATLEATPNPTTPGPTEAPEPAPTPSPTEAPTPCESAYTHL